MRKIFHRPILYIEKGMLIFKHHKYTLKAFFLYLHKHLSVLVIVLVCLTVTEVHLNLTRHKSRNVIAWDVVGYYSYLPATFIDKDLKLGFITTQNYQNYYGLKYAFLDDAQGNHVFKYPMGMAVLYAPFFFTAHALAEPLGYAPDGYSEIYQLFIEYSGLFYLLFGLILLRRVLLMYYSEKVTALSLFVIYFGTNLLCYSTLDAAMSHSYSFSLLAALLYSVTRYYQHPKLSWMFVCGLLLGLIILVRPPNILFGLLILLFGVRHVSDLKQRFLFMVKHYGHLLALLLTVTLVLLPQLLYWHYVTGHYLVFSYGEEGFFFSKPQLWQCLLGFRKGWLIYSPVFFFALAGLYLMRQQRSGVFLSTLLVLLPLYLYIVSSWWCWWYGGSFSLRPMIDLYPLLCFPLAACFVKVASLTKTPRYLFSALLAFLVLLNICQTFQYKYTIIHYDAMTFRSYLNAFTKTERKATDTSLLDHPDYAKALKGE